MSDEEVEEAEASDSFPALGYPSGLGSQLGSGGRMPRCHALPVIPQCLLLLQACMHGP